MEVIVVVAIASLSRAAIKAREDPQAAPFPLLDDDIGKPPPCTKGVMLSSCQPSADARNVAVCGSE